jgi:hypothetical protein
VFLVKTLSYLSQDSEMFTVNVIFVSDTPVSSSASHHQVARLMLFLPCPFTENSIKIGVNGR